MATAGTYPHGYSWWANTATATTIPTNTSHLAGSAGEVVSEKLHRAMLESNLLLGSFTGGEQSGQPVIAKRDLKKGKGDMIHMLFISDLAVQPLDQGKAMWQSTNRLQLYQDSVGLGVIKQAIGHDRPMSEQRNTFDLLKADYAALERWFVNYGPELMLVRRLTGETYYDTTDVEIGGWSGSASTDPGIGPDTNPTLTCTNIMYGGDATSEATIDETDVLSPAMIWKAVEACRVGKLGSTTMRAFAPIPVAGGKYVGIFHPYAIGDLKYAAGSEWIDYQKYANLRGNDNPLFAGTANYAGMYPTPIGELYGMLIYDYIKMPTHTDWGSGAVNGASGLVLGSEAIAYAEGFGPEWTQEVLRHNEGVEIGVKLVAGAKVLQWNSIDNASIVVKTAAKIHS